MQRRKFVIGMGALATGTAAAVGSGAFSSMSSGEREVDVNVAADSSSFLQIYPSEGPNGAYAVENPGTLSLNFNEDADTFMGNGKGVNPGSVYEFDNVFKINNVATQEVDVWLTKSDLPGVYFYFDGDSSKSLLFGDWDGMFDTPESLNPSAPGIEVGVKIVEEELNAGSLGEISGSVTVHAEASPDTAVRNQ